MHLHMDVTVRGDGVAAQCCARLLEAGGARVSRQRQPRKKLPAIMIGGMTQKLFCDVFERADLFRGMPAITRRVVAWGPDAEAVELPHSAVFVDEEELLERLRPATEVAYTDAAAEWTIIASRPLPEACVDHRFGSRTARSMAVQLHRETDASTCWVESLEHGWLFLIPGAHSSGRLLAVGDLGESVLAGSRLVSRQIAELTGDCAEFPSHPRIGWPLCGVGWLACGTAALGFDPLCGDGSGNALREAILAAAVLRCIQNGESREELLAHYRSRLLGGFQRHLEACEAFYRTGGVSPWWHVQLQAVRTGLRWCALQLADGVSMRYRLRGFDLERTGVPQNR